MKALRNLACAAVMAGMMFATVTMANAEEMQPNNEMAPGVWYNTWMGPTNLSFGTPDHGVMWQEEKAYGEVRYIDGKYMSIALDESGDIANYYLYENETMYTPSWDGIRVGSKVEVQSDNRSRTRSVKVIPFYQWLKNQAD